MNAIATDTTRHERRDLEEQIKRWCAVYAASVWSGWEVAGHPKSGEGVTDSRCWPEAFARGAWTGWVV